MSGENIDKIISDGARRLHIDELSRMRLRYSVLEKSIPALSGVGIREILKLKLPRDVKREAVEAQGMIKAHELYFSSFAGGICRCDRIKEHHTSENAFLYDIMREALPFGEGFCFLMMGRSGVYHFLTKMPCEAFIKPFATPVLALDLYEHAYFIDYGFEREEYLKRALSFWNLTLIK